MVTGCVSSRWVHDCEGEGKCGFYGLPHVLCVPVPPYAQARQGLEDARLEDAAAPLVPQRSTDA